MRQGEIVAPEPEPPSDALVAEFDTVASWTAEAIAELGAEYAIPAACRGSGTPAALEWLGDQLRLTPGSTLLDVGAGAGGPAAFAADRFEVRPVLLEPMFGACASARDLFALPIAAGAGEQLPFRDGVFDAVWSLGVLCTARDQLAALREIRRVLRPAGLVGLLVYVKAIDPLPDQPEGNNFPTPATLARLLADAGLDIRAQAATSDFPVTQAWQDRANAVERFVAAHHRHDLRWLAAEQQSQTMSALLHNGFVRGELLVAQGY